MIKRSYGVPFSVTSTYIKEKTTAWLKNPIEFFGKSEEPFNILRFIYVTIFLLEVKSIRRGSKNKVNCLVGKQFQKTKSVPEIGCP